MPTTESKVSDSEVQSCGGTTALNSAQPQCVYHGTCSIDLFQWAQEKETKNSNLSLTSLLLVRTGEACFQFDSATHNVFQFTVCSIAFDQ